MRCSIVSCAVRCSITSRALAVSKLLDRLLGDEISGVYTRQGLIELVKLNVCDPWRSEHGTENTRHSSARVPAAQQACKTESLCVRVRACARARVRVCVCALVRVCACTTYGDIQCSSCSPALPDAGMSDVHSSKRGGQTWHQPKHTQLRPRKPTPRHR